MGGCEGRLTIGDVELIPLADESTGVRSMCLYVETPDVRILLDPGVSLAPRRFGLYPHPLEFRAVKEARERIVEYARRADVVTASHYHFDHITPGFASWYEWLPEPDSYRKVYEGKVVLAKDVEKAINHSQKMRGFAFRRNLEGVADELVYADGRRFEFGSTVVEASPPLPHGPEGTKLGWVVAFSIAYRGIRVLFAPDVQGPVSDFALQYILEARPAVLVVGGPPTYLAGSKVRREQVERGLANLSLLKQQVECLVVSHHLLRDENWRERVGGGVLTYSSIAGREEMLLEARRKRLYAEEEPSEEFMKWLEDHLRKGDKSRPPPI